MSAFQNARFSEHGRGLFTPREIEQRMRIEFERSQRHGLPLVCLLIGVDRLGTLQDLYGSEAREEILETALDTLREATREHDLVCTLQDDRILALFPHTPPELGGLLARKLLEAARKLRFERDGRTLRVSLSIGVAHNRHQDAISFDTLLAVAEEGLRVADAAGGDRFVETELYQLFEKKRRAREREQERQQVVYVQAPAAPAPTVPSRATALGETLLEILSAMGVEVGDDHALDRDALRRILFRLQDEKAHASHVELAEARRQNDILERRIAKLTSELGLTEEELKRIAEMKNVDLGIASIYRSVQGLAANEVQAQRKREMMKEIFTANFELKKELDERTGSSG